MIRKTALVAELILLSLVAFAQVLRAAGPDEPAQVKEAAESEVRGVVVMESDGKPVANAEVRLTTWHDNGRRFDTKKAATNDRGEFVFKDIAPGKHRLAAFVEDFSSRESLYKGDSVDLSNKQPVKLILRQMPSIAVSVVSKADGKPLKDALVRLIWTDTKRDHRTDDSGKVLLRTLTNEVWHVEVKAKGFAEQEHAVNLSDTEAAELKVELVPGGNLSGKIKDEAGQALAGAGISVFPADYRGGQIEYLTTDGEGRFVFDSLPYDKALVLRLSKDGYLDASEEITLKTDDDRNKQLDLVLKERPHGG